MRAIRVLLCDDHLIVRQALKQTLADVPDVTVIDEVDTGAGCLRLAQRLLPDVLLLDIALAGRDGLATLAALREQCPRLPVLMLSTFPERQYAVPCLQLGAAGYLHKSADAQDLLSAIRTVAAGHLYITAATAEALSLSMQRHPEPVGLADFSPQEQQVFHRLASGQNPEQIAAELALSSNTVSTCRARLLEKTGARNHVELALYAARQRDLDP